MKAEEWGEFALVEAGPDPRGIIEIDHPPSRAPAADLYDQNSGSPWAQPQSTRVQSVSQLGPPLGSAETKVPRVIPAGLVLSYIHERRTRTNQQVIEVALCYAQPNVIVKDLDDCELHVVWNVMLDRPLTRVVHPQPFPVTGSTGIGGWIHSPQKVMVGDYPGLFTAFEANPPVTARAVNFRNALQWFEGAVYRVVQGYGDLGELMTVAQSIARS